MKIALSIAGSDPTGGAGLQADLQVFRALGVHGMGVVTALTVQDTARVHEVLPAFPSVVLKQLRALLRSTPPDALKLGMLASDDVARNVELGLRELDPVRRTPIVIDPVLAASDGTPLLERRAYGMLQDLIGRATLVTPNLLEAAALTGSDVSTREGVEAAAAQLVNGLGARAALVKGGHLDGSDVVDVLFDGATRIFRQPRVMTTSTHGTGCTLSAAITARIALGDGLGDAVAAGLEFVHRAIRTAPGIGGGHGPLNHWA